MLCQGGKREYRMIKDKGQPQKPGEHQHLRTGKRKGAHGRDKKGSKANLEEAP